MGDKYTKALFFCKGIENGATTKAIDRCVGCHYTVLEHLLDDISDNTDSILEGIAEEFNKDIKTVIEDYRELCN